MADEHERRRIINVVGRQDSNLQLGRYERQNIDQLR
jgi:hypothetical protein